MGFSELKLVIDNSGAIFKEEENLLATVGGWIVRKFGCLIRIPFSNEWGVDNRGTIYQDPPVTFTAGVCGGDPCVPGTRIPAALLYEYSQKLGWSIADLVEAYPELTWKQVEAALVWIQEHPAYWHDWVKKNAY